MFVTNNLLKYLIISVFVIIPFWKIFEKAGFHPALRLLAVVPVANLVILYYLGFTKWTGKK